MRHALPGNSAAQVPVSATTARVSASSIRSVGAIGRSVLSRKLGDRALKRHVRSSADVYGVPTAPAVTDA